MAKSKVLIKPKERHVIRSIDVAGDRVLVAQTNLTFHSLKTGRLAGTHEARDPSSFILRARFAPDGKTVAIVDTSLQLSLHDADAGETRVVDVGDKKVQWVSYARDRNRLAVAGLKTQVWDGDDGKVVWALQGGRKKREEPAVACLSADGSTVAVGGAEKGVIALYEVDSGKRRGELEGAPDLVGTIEMDARGRWLACSEANHHGARLWSLETGEQIEPEDFADKDGAVCVRFSADGKLLALGWTAGTSDVYASATGENVYYDKDHARRVWDLVFTPDGKSLLSAGDDATVRIRKLP